MHWYCHLPNGQIQIYREYVSAASGEELGVELARCSAEELQHTRRLTAFLAPDFFDSSVIGKSLAREIAKGIDRVFGPQATFTFEFTEQEQQMTAERALLSLEARKRQATQASIFVKAANGERSGGWEYFRGLLRWWPLNPVQTISYDREIARRLEQGPDGQQRLAEYMKQVTGEPRSEPLPGIVIWEGCSELIRSLSALVKDGNKMDATVRAISAESALYGLMGHHENPEIRPPREAFTAQRIDALHRRNPTPDAMQIHMAVTQAEADYNKKYGPQKGWTLSRRRGRWVKH